MTDPGVEPALDPSQGAAASTSRPWSFAFTGQGGALLGIAILNLILNVVTLGIWFGWGRVRELRYLIGETRIEGDPLSFHGRGGELLRGVLIAFFAFLVPIYALFFMAGRTDSPAGVGFILLGYLLLLLLVAFATVGSIRYRLPRIEWRGIRFGFDGRTGGFLAGYLPRMLLVIASFGLAYPLYAAWRREWMVEYARFGTVRFVFDGEAGPLYPRFLVCWLLGIPTLGLAWVYYVGFQQAYFWNCTSLADSRFESRLTGTGWLRLQLVNGLLAVVTLGIAGPWIVARTHRYFFETLSLPAGLDLAAIRQDRQRTGGVGQGALDVLDMDSGLDLG